MKLKNTCSIDLNKEAFFKMNHLTRPHFENYYLWGLGKKDEGLFTQPQRVYNSANVHLRCVSKF
jgi:hypothetical protein